RSAFERWIVLLRCESMQLTPPQLRALTSICDTFAPKSDGWPAGSELGVPNAIAAAMDFNPRGADHKQFLQLMDIWDSRLHALLTVGSLAQFSHMDQQARTRMLLSWAESSLGTR